MARVYIAYDLAGLTGSSGRADSFSRAHAVTPGLRAEFADLDEEALEHYAMTEAAQESLLMLADRLGQNRRVVLAAEAEHVTPVEGALTLVEVSEIAVPQDVIAWLVDTEEAIGAVAAAAAGLRSGDGETDTSRLVEACLDHELAWYAAGELDVVLALA